MTLFERIFKTRTNVMENTFDWNGLNMEVRMTREAYADLRCHANPHYAFDPRWHLNRSETLGQVYGMEIKLLDEPGYKVEIHFQVCGEQRVAVVCAS